MQILWNSYEMCFKPVKYIVISYLLISIFCTCFIYAAGSEGVSGADFLEIGIGSRPLGMGEAFTAALNDINSIYYNPAGLGTMKHPLLSLMHQELIVDSRFENVSLAFPLFSGFFGISNSVFWVPPFEKIDEEGNKVGEVYFYNTSTVLAYGQSIGFMEIGGSLKYIYQRIDTLMLHSVAFDLGVLKRLYVYSPFEAPVRNFTLGFSIQNVGSNAKDDPLPRTIRFGTSYYATKWLGVYMDFIENFIDASDFYDFTYGFDESFRINAGLEFSYFDIIAFRAGYRFNDAGKYSLGMGFNYAIKNVSFVIDTSYSDSGVFGPVYSFTVSLKLIPRVITVKDKLRAAKHYWKGIEFFIKNDVDAAIEEFIKCKELNPYHKDVKQKIEELEELRRLKKENVPFDQEIEERS